MLSLQVITRPPPVSLDKENATYLVSGGLGGIGRAIAEWIIRKGAKNVLLVSRKASSHPEAAKLTEEAEAIGCRLLIRDCDVSDRG